MVLIKKKQKILLTRESKYDIISKVADATNHKTSNSQVPKGMIQKHFKKTFDKAKVMW